MGQLSSSVEMIFEYAEESAKETTCNNQLNHPQYITSPKRLHKIPNDRKRPRQGIHYLDDRKTTPPETIYINNSPSKFPLKFKDLRGSIRILNFHDKLYFFH